MNDRFTFAWPDEAEELSTDHPTAERVRFPDGTVASINYEEHCEHADPREHDNVGIMHVYRPGYSLGDEQLPEGGFDAIECETCEGDGEIESNGDFSECAKCEGMGEIQPTVEQWAKAQGAIGLRPLFIFEHSGMTISCGRYVDLRTDDGISPEDTASRNRFVGDEAGWDTSFSGFILATEERVKETGVESDPETLAGILEGEVSEYASYLEGEVYWWEVESEDGAFSESCGGYVGDIAYAREAAYSEGVEYVQKQVAAEARERAEMAARDIVTVGA